ncbi:YIP1 family protein [Azotobacter armeniacus]
MTLHARQLISHPEQIWREICQEEDHNGLHYLPHLLLLSLIPAVSLFIGTTFVGRGAWSTRSLLYATSIWGVGLLMLLTILLFWQYLLQPNHERTGIERSYPTRSERPVEASAGRD